MKLQLPSTRTSRALTGLAADYFGTSINIVLAFLVTPWLVHLLKSELYGFWIVAVQVLFWLNVLDGGSGIYLIQAISRHQSDQERVNRAVATVFWMYVLLAAVTLAIGWSLAPAVCRWAHVATQHTAAAVLTFRISAIAVTVTLVLGSTFQAILSGYQKLALVNTIASCVAGSALLVGVILVKLGGGIVSLAIAQLISTLAGGAVTIAFARRLFPLKLSARLFDRSELRETFRFAAYFQMSKAAFLANTFSDGLLIAGSLGTAAVTVYSLTQKLAMTSSTFITKISGALIPGLAEIFVTGDRPRIQSVTLRLTHILSRMSILAFLVLTPLNQRFVELWVGRQYFGGVLVTFLFAYIALRNGLVGTFASYLFSTGDLTVWGWLSLLEAGTKISLTIILLPHVGIVAPAIGTAAAGLITGIYLPFKIASMSGVRIAHLLRQGLWPCIQRSVPTAAVIVILHLLVPVAWGWAGLACIITAGLVTNTVSFDRQTWNRLRLTWA